MYPTSTQKRFWTFESADSLLELRKDANQKFIHRHQAADVIEQDPRFLTVHEETELCHLVADTAVKFCRTFEPPMPPSVIWTAFTYFKRFYLYVSAMEYSPKNTMMGCLYLACKVDEFNVSASEFVRNLKSGTPEGNLETVLSLEPILVAKMNFQLTVHCPFRPMEGLLIDLKVKWPTYPNPDETLRPGCEQFLQKALLTDACLLYPPSQIALAALFHSAEMSDSHGLEPYIQNSLLHGYEDGLDKLMLRLREIRDLVMAHLTLGSDSAAQLQRRAKECMMAIRDLETQKLTRKSTEGMDAADEPGDEFEDDSD